MKIPDFIKFFLSREEENVKKVKKRNIDNKKFIFRVVKNNEEYGIIYDIPAESSEIALSLLKSKLFKEFLNRRNITEITDNEDKKIILKPNK